jgi:septal ring factor EnvC (AmiA/AmiB activator)
MSSEAELKTQVKKAIRSLNKINKRILKQERNEDRLKTRILVLREKFRTLNKLVRGMYKQGMKMSKRLRRCEEEHGK